jgi:hypothetical protein
MDFVHIATLSDAHDWIAELNSKRKVELKDSVEFSEWLEGHRTFPVEFYLNGITYRFDNRLALDYFTIGFDWF